MTYSNTLNQLRSRFPSGAKAGIVIEDLAQLKTQNTYNTHLDIAKSMASVMREDMARYEADSRQFTQSLGCWSGFHAMQMMRAIKRQKGTLDGAIQKIDEHESYVRPIIADIDAGFGNVHATYLLAKEMIKAGACCLQIENQVSDAKQCGHQDGKVTVPREDFVEKLRACRMAFEELGVDDGVIVARTDSLGAGPT